MSKWHKNLTTAFKNCLESRDYMHVRNALAVLEKIIGQYPQVDFHGNSLEEKVGAIAGKGETRGDLQVRAQGYLALLRKSSKSWISSAKFGSQSKSSTPAANSPNTNRPTTPQATLSPARTTSSTATDREILRTRSTLNPAAPSFKPHDDEHRYRLIIQ
jgi:THO complex subunit 2